jgi:hypothetical protein
MKEEEVKDWAKRHIVDVDNVLDEIVAGRDEYKLFSGPHGRKIVARVNRYKRNLAIVYGCCCVSVCTSIWFAYLYIAK